MPSARHEHWLHFDISRFITYIAKRFSFTMMKSQHISSRHFTFFRYSLLLHEMKTRLLKASTIYSSGLRFTTTMHDFITLAIGLLRRQPVSIVLPSPP